MWKSGKRVDEFLAMFHIGYRPPPGVHCNQAEEINDSASNDDFVKLSCQEIIAGTEEDFS
jgi:hypothetical protein